jgi:L-Ala-D/L-Glu epimerase
MKLSYQPFLFELRHPFRIANNIRTTTPAVYTEIGLNGFVGKGESALPPYLGESHESVLHFLSLLDLSMFEYPFDIGQIMAYVDGVAEKNTAAKAGVDIALWNLKSQIEGVPVWKLMGADKSKMPVTSCTLGIDTPEVMHTKVLEAGAFKVLKIKLGSEDDKALIRSVRQVTDKPLYVDANQGWKNKEEGLDMAQWLAEEGVVLIEQPLEKHDLKGALWMRERTPIPIVADESFQRLSDLDAVADCFDAVNIKLMKCTGLTEAQKIIVAARARKMKVMVGCMTESSCAIMAAASIAPLCDWVDLDGPWLIANNPFATPVLRNGRIVL